MLAAISVCVLAGCENSRVVGKWKGTYDGETHELEFKGSGRLWRSSDLVGSPGWTTWEQTRQSGKKRTVKAGNRSLIITFDNINHIQVYDESNQNRFEMDRVVDETAEEENPKSYAMAYMLVVLAIAFGLVGICRPSRRARA